jgi:hypothetical protein
LESETPTKVLEKRKLQELYVIKYDNI